MSVSSAIKMVFLSSLLIPVLSAWRFLWIWTLWLIFSYLSLLIILMMSHHFPSFLEGSNNMISPYKSHVPCLGAQGVFFNSKYFYKVYYMVGCCGVTNIFNSMKMFLNCNSLYLLCSLALVFFLKPLVFMCLPCQQSLFATFNDPLPTPPSSVGYLALLC